MATTNDLDFRFLYQIANRAMGRLRTDADSSRKHRSSALGEHLVRTLDRVEGRISRSAERFVSADEVDRLTQAHVLRGVNSTLADMQEATDWVAKAEDPRLHLGVLYFIDQISRELGGRNIRVTPIPDGRYGYSAFSWPFKDLLENLGDKEPMSGYHPVVVSYPPHEEESTLLSPLFGHEIAHAAVDEEALVDEVLSARDQHFEKRFSDFANRYRGVSDPEGRLQLKIESWITELLCDSLATHYLGPSYLFAFAPSVIATGLDEFPEAHPPTVLRIKHILYDLRKLGWIPLLRKRMPSTLRWLERLSATKLMPFEAWDEFCMRTAVQFEARISEVAAEHLGDTTLASSAFEADLNDLMSFLSQRILPCQMPDGRPTDRRSIVLSAWIFQLQKSRLQGDDAERIAKAIEGHEFQAFIAAAFEMSFVLEAWNPS